MHNLVIVIVVLVVVILVVRAWKKDTIEVEMPVLTPRSRQQISRPTLMKKKRKNRSNKEEMCRDIFQDIFAVSFPTKRPKFLRNPETGRNLELDGYNADLQLAFEYNGKQHYAFPNTFHKTREDFDKQLYRDEFKTKKCEELGIKLLSIPYTVPKKQLEPYIRLKLEKMGVAC